MEHINFIKIRGVVGYVRFTPTKDSSLIARFQVATEYVYAAKDGSVVLETTWHIVVATPNDNITIEDLTSLIKGKQVMVTGRMRSRKEVDASNNTIIYNQLVAKTIQFINPNLKKLEIERQ